MLATRLDDVVESANDDGIATGAVHWRRASVVGGRAGEWGEPVEDVAGDDLLLLLTPGVVAWGADDGIRQAHAGLNDLLALRVVVRLAHVGLDALLVLPSLGEVVGEKGVVEKRQDGVVVYLADDDVVDQTRSDSCTCRNGTYYSSIKPASRGTCATITPVNVAISGRRWAGGQAHACDDLVAALIDDCQSPATKAKRRL